MIASAIAPDPSLSCQCDVSNWDARIVEQDPLLNSSSSKISEDWLSVSGEMRKSSMISKGMRPYSLIFLRKLFGVALKELNS